MKELKYFGIPVSINDKDILDYNRDAVKCDDYKRKYAEAMNSLLYSSEQLVEHEPYYDFYKAICRKEDDQLFSKKNLRFDATVILPGKTGNEYKKTAGHFHKNIVDEKHSYPELYQVVYGKALFIMQKVKSYDGKLPMEVEDLMLAEVKAGETIVVPPDYGHATVNIGETPMVFINLVSIDSNNHYDSVAASEGMSVFILDNGSKGYIAVKNKKYRLSMEPKIVLPSDCPQLSIIQGQPAYNAYIAQPEKFTYLDKPLQYMPYFIKQFVEKSR